MVQAGFAKGNCQIKTTKGDVKNACEVMLKKESNRYFRLIKSIHLSRPEHYLSIYQSGCNHSCLKCHSWEFSQFPQGKWLSTDELAKVAAYYERKLTVWEPRERATMWHGTSICRSCGACVFRGIKGDLCPGVLKPEQVILSPQGFGPARNIIAFTGGDLACQVDFYAEATLKIKKNTKNIWVLLETNGYGLIPKNLDILKEAGLDSFWLDIKAYSEPIYQRLCGTTNQWILKAPEEIKKRGFVLEILTLFIPGWVEFDEIRKIGLLIARLDPAIPFTILAFFGAYKLLSTRPPSLSEMCRAYMILKDLGLHNIRLGNLSVFAGSTAKREELLKMVGKEALG
jgi:pyruvate-formate lyase-activating enzyme